MIKTLLLLLSLLLATNAWGEKIDLDLGEFIGNFKEINAHSWYQEYEALKEGTGFDKQCTPYDTEKCEPSNIFILFKYDFTKHSNLCNFFQPSYENIFNKTLKKFKKTLKNSDSFDSLDSNLRKSFFIDYLVVVEIDLNNREINPLHCFINIRNKNVKKNLERKMYGMKVSAPLTEEGKLFYVNKISNFILSKMDDSSNGQIKTILNQASTDFYSLNILKKESLPGKEPFETTDEYNIRIKKLPQAKKSDYSYFKLGLGNVGKYDYNSDKGVWSLTIPRIEELERDVDISYEYLLNGKLRTEKRGKVGRFLYENLFREIEVAIPMHRAEAKKKQKNLEFIKLVRILNDEKKTIRYPDTDYSETYSAVSSKTIGVTLIQVDLEKVILFNTKSEEIEGTFSIPSIEPKYNASYLVSGIPDEKGDSYMAATNIYTNQIDSPNYEFHQELILGANRSLICDSSKPTIRLTNNSDIFVEQSFPLDSKCRATFFVNGIWTISIINNLSRYKIGHF